MTRRMNRLSVLAFALVASLSLSLSSSSLVLGALVGRGAGGAGGGRYADRPFWDADVLRADPYSYLAVKRMDPERFSTEAMQLLEEHWTDLPLRSQEALRRRDPVRASYLEGGAFPVEEVREFIEASMECFQLPGLSITVVQDGEIVFAEGFGYADVENQVPMTADTLISIGSTTKSFTSAGLGILTDEGKLDYDTRFSEIFGDEFTMDDPVTQERLTLRDALSHQSGLPRHDYTWAPGSSLTRKEFALNMGQLFSKAEFRYIFQYCNLMYSASGHVIEHVSGKSWEDFTRDEILEPLGMDSTCMTMREALDRFPNRTAKVYTYTARTLRAANQEANFNIEPVAPAGSIISSTNDMAKWMQLHIENGAFSSMHPSTGRLLSEETFSKMHGPHMLTRNRQSMIVSPEFPVLVATDSYGLGWFTGYYRSYLRQQHGGSVFGHSGLSSYYPDLKLGISILVNADYGGLGLLDVYKLIELFTVDAVMGFEPWLSSELVCQLECHFLPFLPWCTPADNKNDAKKSDERATSREKMPPVPNASEFVGMYLHPYYGNISVTEPGEEGDLRATLSQMEGALRPIPLLQDSFLYSPSWYIFSDYCTETAACLGIWEVQFLRDGIGGEVVGAEVSFEGGVEFVKTQ